MTKSIINLFLFVSSLMVALSAQSAIQNGQWSYKTTGAYSNYGANYSTYNDACGALLTLFNPSATFQFTSDIQGQPTSGTVVRCFSTYSNSPSSYYVRFLANNTLPNATCTNGYCTCNQGYAQKDANSCALDTNNNGIPDEDENQCENNLIDNNGSCGCSDPNFPHERVNETGRYCSQTTSSQDDAIIALIAAGLGLTIAQVGGLAAGLAACAASIICAAGLTLAGLGALIAAALGADIAFGDDPTPPPPQGQPSPLVVRLPNTPNSTPRPDEITLNPGGSVVPPANSTPQPDGSYDYPQPDGTVKVKPDDAIVVKTSNNPDGSTTTTTVKNTPNGADVVSIRKSPYGLAPNNTPVTKIETSKVNATSSSTASKEIESSIAYLNAGVLKPNPPVGTIQTGGSGSGSGSGDGGGEDENNPSGCPDCAKEVTQLANRELLGSINSKLDNTEEFTSDLEEFGDYTEQDFMDMMIEKTPFYELTNFTPTGTAQCPTIDFDGVDFTVAGHNFSISNMSMDAHCSMANQFRSTLHTIFGVTYFLMAVFILIG